MKGKFQPFNRHLVVDVIEDKKEEKDSLIVLPTDYEKPLDPFVKAIVIAIAEDSKLRDKLSLNDVILVERRMLHKVEISEHLFYLVLENYIYGRINDETDR